MKGKLKILVLAANSLEETNSVCELLENIGYVINEVFPSSCDSSAVSEEAAITDTCGILVLADSRSFFEKAIEIQKDLTQGYEVPVPVLLINLLMQNEEMNCESEIPVLHKPALNFKEIERIRCERVKFLEGTIKQ